ncbi:MAG: 7,8-dihydroneopterin aldolase/epimerase/oxygenase [Chloroflexota bacterium]|nr:7,8-dihydroneopterin aldolase/epimerase/oxygenase [Chloroflexota bacterium]
MRMSGDRLLLEGMEFYGYHGDIEAERALGGRIEVDVEVLADLSAAGRSDALADTLDYVRCFQLVRDIVENRQFHLLEALAEAIAGVLLEQRHARGVRVRVAKTPPVRGGFERFAVVIERERAAG